MGRSYCCVSGCGTHISEGRFFNFPKPLVRAELWKKFCANSQLDEVDAGQLFYRGSICWKHFRVEDFQTPSCDKLNRNAVPILYPPSSQSTLSPSSTSTLRVHAVPNRAHSSPSLLGGPSSSLIIVSTPGTSAPHHLSLNLPSSIGVGGGQQEGYRSIDDLKADLGFPPSELTQEQKQLTTRDSIGLGKRSSDCLKVQEASRFHSSSFANVPADCGVDRVIIKSVPSTSNHVDSSLVPASSHSSNSATLSNGVSSQKTRLPVVKNHRRSTSLSAPLPSSARGNSKPLSDPRDDSSCQEDTLLSVSNIPNSSPHPSKETVGGGTAQTPSCGFKGGTVPDVPDVQDDSSTINISIFCHKSPPHPSRSLTVPKKNVQAAGVEFLTASFFAGARGESPVFVTDPYYKYKLCRLCFRPGKSLTLIFGGEFNKFDLKDAVEDLTHFRVSKSDDYPQKICEHCLPKLVKFKRFKDQFLKNKALFDKELKKRGKRVDEEGFCSRTVTQNDKLPKSSSNMPEESNNQPSCSQRGEVCGVVMETSKTSTDVATSVAMEQEQDTHDDESAEEENVLSGDVDDDMDSGEEEYDNDDFDSPPLETPLEPAPRVSKKRNQVEGVFPCALCDKVFKYRNHKVDHMKEHEKTFLFPCTDCDRRFQSLTKLNSHIVTHSEYKPYECEMCGRRFHHQAGLRRHKVNHTVQRNFVCSECGKDYKDYGSLNHHIRSHKKRKAFICNVCNEEFLQGHSLKRHMKKHDGRKSFVCNVCDKEFWEGQDLKIHMETHALEKTFVCEVCGVAFVALRRLKWHMKARHSGENKFDCDVCGKKFPVRKYMMEHRRWHFEKRVRNRSSVKEVR